jgi:hypothetical protein
MTSGRCTSCSLVYFRKETLVYKKRKIVVPSIYEEVSMFNPDDETDGLEDLLDGADDALVSLQSTEASANDTPTSAAREVVYSYLSLPSDFTNFFDNNLSSILIPEEYPAMLKHITGLYDRSVRGAVVTGQPGIGENAPQSQRGLLNIMFICRKINIPYLHSY